MKNLWNKILTWWNTPPKTIGDRVCEAIINHPDTVMRIENGVKHYYFGVRPPPLKRVN